MIIVEPQDQEATSGSMVRLDCMSEGVPDPLVVWTHSDGKPVYQDSVVSVEKNGSLLFASADGTHEGQYTCWAVNSAGVTQKQAHLRVMARRGENELLSH